MFYGRDSLLFIILAGKGVSRVCWLDESSVVIEVMSWEANGWALAGDGFSGLLKFEAGSVELDFAANLIFEHETTERK